MLFITNWDTSILRNAQNGSEKKEQKSGRTSALSNQLKNLALPAEGMNMLKLRCNWTRAPAQ